MNNIERSIEISRIPAVYETDFNLDKTIELQRYNAAMLMAEWKEQQLIDKACEWLKDNANDYLDWYDWERCWVDKDELVYDFKKAMKGGEE